MFATEENVALQSELLERIDQARSRTDELFAIVRPDAIYERPIPERHRLVFYVGHLEAFDWNLLRAYLPLESFNPKFDRLFAFGIDPVGTGLPADQPSDWPSLAEVNQYRDQIRHALDTQLSAALSHEKSAKQFPASLLLNVAVEHRLMHAETLAYLLHQLPLDRKIRPGLAPVIAAEPFVPSMVKIPAGSATLGISRTEETFGWDNEYESYSVQVPAFAIDRYKVTNFEYLEFIAAGGYENQELWSKPGWQWRTEHQISHPSFWKRNPADNGWDLRTMFDEIPLPLSWPVYVSHAEAAAYACWAGKSLPTEAQWHRAAFAAPNGTERDYPWGSQPPDETFGNFNFSRWDPTPVNAFPKGASAFGVTDLIGNGWEWTSTPFAPFAGFEAFPFYRGYSADFFDGNHYVIKGGSAWTAACMLRRSFRNWFQPHYQYVYAGFRCVSR